MSLENGIQAHLFAHVLSVEPLIVFGYGTDPFQPAHALSPQLREHKAYFLQYSGWCLHDPAELNNIVSGYFRHKTACPHHEFIYLLNDPREANLLKPFGIPAVYCNQNGLVDERTFRIYPDLSQSFDAIYNARLDPFKRHHLCRKLRSVGFIYYNTTGQEGWDYLTEMLELVPQATPLNKRPGRSYVFLGTEEICRFYNRSGVGLCLSEAEGGNFTSVEYLLSGIPVVSTHSLGGRETFLDPEFSRIVAPTAEAVRDGVQELLDLSIPADAIRRKTLLNCLTHRETFQRVVQHIYDIEGAGRRFADEWDTVYVNKMLNWGIPDNQVVSYVKQWRGRTDKVVERLRRRMDLEKAPLPHQIAA